MSGYRVAGGARLLGIELHEHDQEWGAEGITVGFEPGAVELWSRESITTATRLCYVQSESHNEVTMSNASYLLALDADRPAAEVSPALTIRTGYGMVPALWIACFRRGDLASIGVPVQDASGQEGSIVLDMLLTSRANAVANLRAFHKAIRSCASMLKETDPLLQKLIAALESSRARSIQLHDVELQMMLGPEESRPWTAGCLSFVEDVASGRLSGDQILAAPQALELFDQAQIKVPEWLCELEWEESLIGVTG